MKSIVLYLLLVAVGAGGFFAADRIFEFRSNYYHNKYELEVRQVNEKLLEIENEKTKLNNKIVEMSAAIEARDKEIEVVETALRKKKENYTSMSADKANIEKRAVEAVASMSSMDDVSKCKAICEIRKSLGYECGEYAKCEK